MGYSALNNRNNSCNLNNIYFSNLKFHQFLFLIVSTIYIFNFDHNFHIPIYSFKYWIFKYSIYAQTYFNFAGENLSMFLPYFVIRCICLQVSDNDEPPHKVYILAEYLNRLSLKINYFCIQQNMETNEWDYLELNN